MLCAAALGLLTLLAGCTGGLTDGLTTGSTSDSAFKPDLAELKKAGPLPEKTLGKPNAPVTIIEYASLGCPLCSAFHKKVFPKFKAAYIDTGKVYYIYREFPIGASSAAAAQAARCVPEKHYFRVSHKFMANRDQWNGRQPDPDHLYKIVQDTGLSRAAFDSCMANQKISEGIDWVKQQGRKFSVKGTPTFFVDSQQIRGAMSFEEMQRIIEEHLNSAAKPA
jgi:protein-disulfide isomerase